MKPAHFLFLLSGLSATLGSVSVAAPFDAIDTPFEELVRMRILSTPKFAEDPDQVPTVVSILTAGDIRAFGWRTVGDALRSLQGFNVTDDHVYAYAGTRGISPPGDYRARMQVLIDGVAINEYIYGSAPIDGAFPLDIELVERIEVIRGPSASVYGGDALFGVINVVTRGDQSLSGPELGLVYGSGRQRQARWSWGGQVGDSRVVASLSGFDADGRTLSFSDVDPGGMNRAIPGVGAEQGGRLFIQTRGTDWRLTLIHGERERIVPHGSYGTIVGDRGHTEADRLSAFDLSKDWRLDRHAILQQRLYVNAYGYDGRFPYDYSPADPRVVNVDKARGDHWGIENRLVYTAWAGHRWTLGMEYQALTRLNQLNYDVGFGCYGIDDTPCLDSRRRSHRFSLYAQDEMRIGPASTLSLGLRYDRQADVNSTWSPRIGFTHDAEAAGLFKLLYGTAFRIPAAYELAYTPATFPYGNPALDPERMRSLEFAWEKRFSRAARLGSALYHFTIDKMIVPDAAGIVANGRQTRATGLEVEYEHLWSNGIRLRTGFSVQSSRSESGRLDNSPRQMAKANLLLPWLWQGMTAGLEGQWIGARLGNDGREKLRPHLLVNLNLSHVAPGNKWDAGLGIYNLFDHRYADPVSIDTYLPITRWYIPQFGRTLQLRARIGF